MKINTAMPAALKPYYQKEVKSAAAYVAERKWQQAWYHLERAHILGQPYPLEHSAVHWQMLQFGLATKNTREVVGQIPRLVFGGVKSFVGTIPTGNTGGANVSALRPMEIPEELKTIIRQTTNPS